MTEKAVYQPQVTPYTLPEWPQDKFELVWMKLIESSVDSYCRVDPANAEVYKTLVQRYWKEINDPNFKENFRDYFQGCFDPESPLFKEVCYKHAIKIMTYVRYLYELDTDKENLDKIKVENPIFICAVPRCGTTFLHTLLSSAPKAKAIRMYEHLLPGSKTMTKEGRLKLAHIIRSVISNNDEEKKNAVHNIDDIMNFEEELFWKEMIGLDLINMVNYPRLEAYRTKFFQRDYKFVFESVINEMKMSAAEFPLPENGYFCMKCADHFLNPDLFFNVQCKDEFKPRIIWLHREIVQNIRSAILLYYYHRSVLDHDLGLEDFNWLNKTVVDMTEIMLKNAMAEREKWVAENPERAKFICDVSFSELIKDPMATCKKIYAFFEMEWDDEIEACIQKTIENGHPQKHHGRLANEVDKYLFDEDELRKRFNFYYEKYAEYLPNWNVSPKK